MDTQPVKDFARDWYTMTRSVLPEFGTIDFVEFAAQSTAFIYKLNPKESGITLGIDKNTESAYVDMGRKAIYFSPTFFNPDFYIKRFDETDPIGQAELAISVINGMVVHESLHIAHTNPAFERAGVEKRLDAAMNSTKLGREVMAKYGKNVSCSALNIIEDLHIEALVPDSVETWLQACSDMMFDEDDFDKINTEAPTLNDHINLGVMFKNKRLRGNAAFDALTVQSLKALVEAASGEASLLSRRVNLAARFLLGYELPESKESEDSESGDSDGEGSDESKEGEKTSSGKSSEDGDESEESESGKSKEDSKESESSEVTPGTGSQAFRDALEDVDELPEELVEELEKVLEEISEEIAEKESEYTTHSTEYHKAFWKDPIEMDVMDRGIPTRYSMIYPKSDIDFNFMKELVAIRTLNRTPGQARKRGSVMVKQRLTRIATDGKIFAKRDAERQTLKRIEIIINVDLSGSTAGSVIDNELGAAKGISKVLRAAGIAHSVYGHTSIYGDVPLIIHIFSFDMQVTNNGWEARFERIRNISLEQNYDGVAINLLGDRFTDRDGSKYLINLSDGMPAGPGYHGDAAIDHTMQEIKNLRDKRIAVIAMSVVSSVVYHNDKIYGEDFNIDASSNVSRQFMTLIRKLAQA